MFLSFGSVIKFHDGSKSTFKLVASVSIPVFNFFTMLGLCKVELVISIEVRTQHYTYGGIRTRCD